MGDRGMGDGAGSPPPAASPESPPLPRPEPRQCWICLETEDDDRDRPPDTRAPHDWVRPCRCRGSTATCHQRCIRTWVARKREGDPLRPVLCPSCQEPYAVRPHRRPLLIRFAHSLADVYALTPAALFVAALTYGAYLLAAEYGRLAFNALLGQGAGVLEHGAPAWQPSLAPGAYHRLFTLALVAMLFTPLDVAFLLLTASLLSGMPGSHAVLATLAVAADLPSYAYRLLVLRAVLWVRRKFGWAAMARLQTFPPVAALAAAGMLWAVPAVADEIAAHEEDEAAPPPRPEGNGERERADRADEQQLRRLARAVSFPNASVVTSQRAISSTSFVLKIFVLEDRQNGNANQARNGPDPQPQPNAMVPRALYVEYERANILLAVIRSRFFRAQAPTFGVAPRNLRPAALAVPPPNNRQRREVRERRRADRAARTAAREGWGQRVASPPPGWGDPPYLHSGGGAALQIAPPPASPGPAGLPFAEREMRAPERAGGAAGPAEDASPDGQSPDGPSPLPASPVPTPGTIAADGEEDRSKEGSGDDAPPSPEDPPRTTAKGKEKLVLLADLPPAAPEVVEIPAGPPLVRVDGRGPADVDAAQHEAPFLHQPTPVPYRPQSPPTVSVVRRRKDRSREPGHVRRSSGRASEAVRPLAQGDPDIGRPQSPDRPPLADNPHPAAAAPPANNPPAAAAAAAHVPGPREAFLAIDVRTVRTHVYHLVAHTLLLPFVVAFLGEYLVHPCAALLHPYLALIPAGAYLAADFLRWLAAELLRSRASRSALAGFCYGVGREVSVRWWRGRVRREQGEFTVEDWRPPAGEAGEGEARPAEPAPA